MAKKKPESKGQDRFTCPVCENGFCLKKDGNFFTHANNGKRCPGSNVPYKATQREQLLASLRNEIASKKGK